MSELYLDYPLQDGYVHNWLLAGPQQIPLPAGEDRAAVAHRLYRKISDIHQPPVELGTFQVGDTELKWRYAKCTDDHTIDLSGFYPTRHYLRSWAYVQVVSPSEQAATFILSTFGPADVWINRMHAHRQESNSSRVISSVPFQGMLKAGPNEILVRFEVLAERATPYGVGLQIARVPTESLSVELPTWHANVERRQKLERVYQEIHVEQSVITPADMVSLRWDNELDETDNIDFWVQDWQEHIQISGSLDSRPGERTLVGHHLRAYEQGLHRIALTPPAHVITMFDVRYQEYRPFYVLETPYSEAIYGTIEERRKEALEYAARRENNLYGDIARLALGQWPDRNSQLIEDATARIERREEGSVLDLAGLLGMMHRYLKSLYFTADHKRALQSIVLGYKYWLDEPGADIMCYTAESRSILFHTCEILAGQLYPELTFTNTGQTGAWHREKGERLAREWLYTRGTTGFAEWDSNDSFEEDVLALAHLSDLAQDETVRELAAVLLDKLLFTMAVNSFKGVFGSSHGCTEASMIEGGQLEATSGISRLVFGLGVWNDHLRGLVALACSGYEAPATLPAIAVDPGEMWHKEQHPGVNKVTYRTADFMLCSALDYNAGQKGSRQHIWQATLGPNAVVFANHPANMSESPAQRPNCWRGNGVLPRVAQWQDALIAIHNLPAGDWLGFTHAYWPADMFDEQVVENGWAFARVGDGYLALTAAQGLALTTRGPHACRELRSYGSPNIWFCHMGRAQTDGSFAGFQERIRGLEISLDGLAANCPTLRGQILSFGWEGPFTVDGQPQPLSGFLHYDGPFCTAAPGAEQIDINYAGYTLRLDFSLG